MIYEFDFSTLTVGDIKLISSPNATLADHIEFVNKTVVGGIMNMPADSLNEIFEAFVAEMAVWMKSHNSRQSLRDLLADVNIP